MIPSTDFNAIDTSKLQVLLVEDNPADVDLFLECLEDHGLGDNSQVYVVDDGEKAMKFLRQLDKFSSAPSIDLVFLDLNLPRKSGTEVLAELRSSVSLGNTPVVVLTSSNAEEDIIRSYDLKASAYVQKPRTLPGFEELASAIASFWLTKVKYPPKH